MNVVLARRVGYPAKGKQGTPTNSAGTEAHQPVSAVLLSTLCRSFMPHGVGTVKHLSQRGSKQQQH
jgi:hypothetical protein